MRYRNMKTGEERDFVQGMKINNLWQPIRTMKSGKGTMSVTEIHPEDIKRIDDKKADADESSTKTKSSMPRAVKKRNAEIKKKLAAAKEAETVEESV